ncbi:monofunctional biosynthetic peptidoglycan transglycosylase [Propylenella binzhouense]|uniref:monofunctional biosynthetic peptidoglycan transglycosylase n=1 Tax=Propylenella binzhouense TaxID=2555902 RepID=UPI001FE2D9EC|nr:monofunctional biosynthetic peptidoglycan transglycosylase [Propylenella binzhouense]
MSTRGEIAPNHVRRRRRGLLGRVLRRIAWLLALLVIAPFALLPLYRAVDPPVTTVMVLKRIGGAPIDQTWVPMAEISPRLVRAVMMAEDARFCAHSGIDWIEMRNALSDAEDGGRVRGASTITMQLVKNLFLSTGRSYLRKAFEIPLAAYADVVLGKRRTMEIYLNVVEWGPGVYGAEAAARHHFGISAKALSATQAARLAAVLPAPLARDPAKPGRGTRVAASRIAARAAKAGAYDDCVLD